MKSVLAQIYVVIVLATFGLYFSMVGLPSHWAYAGAAGSQGPNGPDNDGGGTGGTRGGSAAGVQGPAAAGNQPSWGGNGAGGTQGGSAAGVQGPSAAANQPSWGGPGASDTDTVDAIMDGVINAQLEAALTDEDLVQVAGDFTLSVEATPEQMAAAAATINANPIAANPANLDATATPSPMGGGYDITGTTNDSVFSGAEGAQLVGDAVTQAGGTVTHATVDGNIAGGDTR